MKMKSLILPVFIALMLAGAVIYWIYQFKTFDVAPRVAGLDNRPKEQQQVPETTEFKGTLQTFDGVASTIKETWVAFRGDHYNAVVDYSASRAVALTPLAKSFPPEGPKELWRVQLGQGYAAPAVRDGRVYLIDYDMAAQADAIRCFSLEDGKEIWRYSYPVKIKRNHGMSRTIPAVTDKYVVSIGPKCHVTCLTAATGQLKWVIDLVAEYGTKVPLWYAGQCPLIVDGKAIVAPAGKDVLMMAVDCETGEIAWKAPNPNQWKMTHCSILPMRFAGQDFYVYPGSGGVAGVSVKDGSLLWETNAWYLKVNIPTPVDCRQGRIFLCAGYGKGSMMLQLTEVEGKIVPTVLFELPAKTFGSDQQTPIYYKGHLYGVRPDKQMVCMDMSGTILWTSGSDNKYGIGPYIIADGVIYVLDDDGILSLIEAKPDGFVQLAKAKVLDGHESWGPPALAGGRLLVRDLTTMVCVDVAAK